MKNRLDMWLVMIVLFGAGVLAGWTVRGVWHGDTDGSSRGHEIREGGYLFTNPLLDCEVARESLGDTELRPFKSKLEELVRKLEDGANVSSVSLYFRDLNNGPWFGINYRAKFAPASLLKVPVMIACLKQAEEDPGFLKTKVRYPGGKDENAGETFKAAVTLIPGASYTIDELLFRMIAYSDNNAMALLMKKMNYALLEKTYTDMGITLSNAYDRENIITVKAYASFFRVLFNASYLNRAMSEKALGLLHNSIFQEGLAAGVPSGIQAAHKFGERVYGQNGEVKQLHDCGIIYYPNNPYLLCVMTRGSSFPRLADAIKQVSGLVYREVDNQLRTRLP